MTVPSPLQQIDRTYVRHRGRNLSYFAGCDYFRLSSHPKVLKAAEIGLKKYGLNVAASRMTTGNHELYPVLEDCLARFFGAQTATLASNGYVPNLMVAQALAGQYSHALVDERAHGCLMDAAQLLDCPILKFKHGDFNHLAQLLGRLGKVKPIVLTDGMFSHNGSIAPIREYLRLLPPAGTLLLDDAHGAGVLGLRGRGTPEYAGVGTEQIIQTITLSKGFGVYGGAVLGPRALREAILSKSRLFVGNTPLPLPLANAAITAVNLLRTDLTLRRRLARNTREFKRRLQAGGFAVLDNPSPIVPVIPRTARESELLKKRLLAAGIHPPFIRYPGAPENGYFRVVISSEHTPAQLEALLKVMLSMAPA
ncbi:MAG: Aminotransferase class [Pedosphaera sp.]|nr:Aminotransferase class [Pedosphaera sp.]